MNERMGLPDRNSKKDHEKEWMNHLRHGNRRRCRSSAWHKHQGTTRSEKMFAPVAAILQGSGAGMLNLVEHCGADIGPMEKAGVPAFSPIRTAVSILIITTQPLTRWTNCPERIGGECCSGRSPCLCACEHGATIATLTSEAGNSGLQSAASINGVSDYVAR
jgi:hypothetical protein